MWTLLFWLLLVAAVPLAVIVARRLRSRRADLSKGKWVILSALPGVFLALGLCVARLIVAAVEHNRPGEVDGSGVMLLAIIAVTPVYGLLVFALGAIAARVALWVE